MNICLSNVYPCWLFSHTTPTTQTAASVCHSKCNLITHPASKPPLFLRLCSLPSCGVAAALREAHKGTAALPSASPFPLWLPHNFSSQLAAWIMNSVCTWDIKMYLYISLYICLSSSFLLLLWFSWKDLGGGWANLQSYYHIKGRLITFYGCELSPLATAWGFFTLTMEPQNSCWSQWGVKWRYRHQGEKPWDLLCSSFNQCFFSYTVFIKAARWSS